MDTSELPSQHASKAATPQAGTPITAPVSDAAAGPAANKGKKRKRTSIKPPRESLVEAETSDLEALDDDWEVENQAPPPPLVDPHFEPDPGDADLWRPSVCTLVPGLKTLMKQPAGKKGGAGSKAAAAAAAAAAEMDDSSASESDFEGPGAGKKAPPKKKAAAASSAKATKPAAVAGNSSSSRETKTSKDAASEKEGADLRPSRKRTKTGCWTCRGRKLKCDEGRPACGQCARSRPPRECVFPDDEDGELS